MAGGRDAWRAWARAAGVLEVTELDHLVETAALLAGAPALAGPRMAMATSSGGIAVLVADALEPRGFTFAPLGEETVRRVGTLLPPYVTVANPLDITAGLPDETFGEVLPIAVEEISPGRDVDPSAEGAATGMTRTSTSAGLSLLSSLVIVPVAPAGVPTLYPVPAVTVKIPVSSGSAVESAIGSSVTVAVEFPARITTVPEVAENVAAPLCV